MTTFGMLHTFCNAITPLTPNCFSKTNKPYPRLRKFFLLALGLVAHILRMVMQFWAIPLIPLQVVIAQLGIEETYGYLVQQAPFHVLGWVYQNLLTYIVHFHSQDGKVRGSNAGLLAWPGGL